MKAEADSRLARDLFWAAMFCFLVGLMTLLFVGWVYLFYWHKIQSQEDDPSVDSAVVESLAVLRTVMLWLVPTLGLGFLLVGCFIWKRSRQLTTRLKVKEADGLHLGIEPSARHG